MLFSTKIFQKYIFHQEKMVEKFNMADILGNIKDFFIVLDSAFFKNIFFFKDEQPQF
jgi:hypothetical protein